MNDFVVGVKPISGSTLAEPGDDSGHGSIGAVWVIVDGQEVACARDGQSNLISVTMNMDAGPSTVTLNLIARTIQTVDFRDKEKYLA
jgi:hypothetical protein